MTGTKVAALVSAYYAEDFIQGRIDNLLNQNGVDLEILIGCQEGSREHHVALTYGDSVKVFPTKGVPPLYQTWNHLIAESNAELLTNANCDDRLYPGALELLAEVLTTNPDVAVVYGFDDIVLEVGSYPVNRHQWPVGGFDDLVLGCFVGPMPMWRSSLHKEYGLFDSEMLVAGDYEFWLRITRNGEKLCNIPQSIGAYVRREDSLEKTSNLRTLWETARARSRYVDWRTYGIQQEKETVETET